MIVAEDEGLSVEEVCDQLIAELAAPEEGDETTLAQVQFWNKIVRSVAKAIVTVEREVKKAVHSACKNGFDEIGRAICS